MGTGPASLWKDQCCPKGWGIKRCQKPPSLLFSFFSFFPFIFFSSLSFALSSFWSLEVHSDPTACSTPPTSPPTQASYHPYPLLGQAHSFPRQLAVCSAAVIGRSGWRLVWADVAGGLPGAGKLEAHTFPFVSPQRDIKTNICPIVPPPNPLPPTPHGAECQPPPHLPSFHRKLHKFQQHIFFVGPPVDARVCIASRPI